MTVSKVEFFKKQNLKPYEYIDIAYNLGYLKQPMQSSVISIGEEGDSFYIILTGSCSVWVPVSAMQMKKIFYEYRALVD
jgi:hypothetical protein